jgi:hypothetical protein
MRQQNIQVAISVAEKLLAAEEAIDDALNKAADLAGFMPLARRQAHVSCSVGQDAIERVLHSMLRLSEARQSMIETHAALAKTQHAARLAPRNYGGFIDKPERAALEAVPDNRIAA